MSLPDVSFVTLSGFVLDFDGNPAEGRMEFVPDSPLLHTTDLYQIEEIPFEVILDADGFFAVSLLATDNANIDPVDWRWRMTERIYLRPDRVFYVSMPAATAVVHYADLVASGEFNEFSH